MGPTIRTIAATVSRTGNQDGAGCPSRTQLSSTGSIREARAHTVVRATPDFLVLRSMMLNPVMNNAPCTKARGQEEGTGTKSPADVALSNTALAMMGSKVNRKAIE